MKQLLHSYLENDHLVTGAHVFWDRSVTLFEPRPTLVGTTRRSRTTDSTNSPGYSRLAAKRLAI
jgi:hypothetical protein